jgi:hypothetical protein
MLLLIYRLDARRAVGVPYGGYLVGLVLQNIVDKEHERRVFAALVKPVRALPPAVQPAQPGLKSSRSFTSFSRACMAGLIGEARMDRLPNARGPNSIRPWYQPMILSCASISAVSSATSFLPCGRALCTSLSKLFYLGIVAVLAVPSSNDPSQKIRSSFCALLRIHP